MKIVSRFQYVYPRCLKRSILCSTNIKVISSKHKLFSSSSHYEVLDVPKTASQDEIKKSFFEKSKKFHPDVSPGNPHHHKIFVKLNDAYSILGDKSKRKDYDRSLRPKSNIYSYQSNENPHQYKDSSFYYRSDFRYDSTSNAKYSANNRPNNYKVALAIVLLMATGVSGRLLWIWNRHKEYKKQLDLNSMKANKLYQESRERSSKYSVEEQIQMLVEKQGSVGRKR